MSRLLCRHPYPQTSLSIINDARNEATTLRIDVKKMLLFSCRVTKACKI
ncbi:hypothetical protein HMPREF3208_00263 [Gardnerella vaginalis]|uniref:Uncharacterized protein n=1 Tax=Gardnerella vaginalis TaxID=2702 RepID=A0A133P210_GARVA|nr:hypothetical protein HMPREF3208_00263 [Gardnerella vaginalis]